MRDGEHESRERLPVETARPREAITDADAARRLRLRRRWGWLVLACGIPLLVGAVAVYVTLDRVYLDRQSRLERHPGTIVDVRGAGSSGGGIVRVEYELDGGRWSAEIHVEDVDRWSGRSSAPVLLDGDDPTLPGENYLPDWVILATAALGAAGIGAFAVGGTTIARTRRRHARLSASPWWRTSGVFGSVGRDGQRLHLAYLHEWTPDRVWECDRGGRALARASRRTRDPIPVDFAGDGEQIAMRAVGTSRLVLATSHPIGDPVRMQVVGRDRGLPYAVLLLRGPAGTHAYELRDSAAAETVPTLSVGDAVTVRRGPASWVLLVLGGTEEMVFATHISVEDRRKRWPVLATS